MRLEIGFAIGALILLIAIIWGVIQTNRRNRAADPIRDEATREVYDNPNYDERRRGELQHEANRRGGP